MAVRAGSRESASGTLRGPTEVTAQVERLLFDAISKAEMVNITNLNDCGS